MGLWGPIGAGGTYRVRPMGLWGDPISDGGTYRVDPIGLWGHIGWTLWGLVIL